MTDAQTTDQLNENDVVDAVCRYLKRSGYEIVQISHTRQQGDDIVAARAGERLIVEAKGATSARESSRRFGTAFSSAQIKVHVAETVYRAVQVLSRPMVNGEKVRAGIALPDNLLHRREIDSVSIMLRKLEIVVFWVSDADNATMNA